MMDNALSENNIIAMACTPDPKTNAHCEIFPANCETSCSAKLVILKPS